MNSHHLKVIDVWEDKPYLSKYFPKVFVRKIFPKQILGCHRHELVNYLTKNKYSYLHGWWLELNDCKNQPQQQSTTTITSTMPECKQNPKIKPPVKKSLKNIKQTNKLSVICRK